MASAQLFSDLPLSERLALARRGTAHYSSQLALIDAVDFGEPTLLSGWSRAHLIAHVAYNAAALCNLMHWARTGEKTPMYASPDARGKEIEFGATLIPDALRNLHDHTVARLDVAWRDLPEKCWHNQVTTAQGRDVPAEETLWMRSREVWIHAVDLDVTAGFGDIPEVILRTLLHEIPGKWAGKGTGKDLVLVEEGGRGERVAVTESATREVRGSLAGLVRWAAGRGTGGVDTDAEPPRWL
ncbi:maleylpyruvate isomerase [Corynebacterium atypicum]|uniref:Maleylpyruvate isomerase n=1 Tax=Corynebacterium atypicum TaxID=191610 RepID=A0ABN4DCG4_9CORY|nr:maleylpyruvate isomerase family mycothiol-dependent enzyme [Corynebacterium atypicum]AIG63883.1 maleylpyruvate isomerase [Corynebacterium atypicum]